MSSQLCRGNFGAETIRQDASRSWPAQVRKRAAMVLCHRPTLGQPGTDFLTRLSAPFSRWTHRISRIQAREPHPARSHKSMAGRHQALTAMGGDGTMVRWYDGTKGSVRRNRRQPNIKTSSAVKNRENLQPKSQRPSANCVSCRSSAISVVGKPLPCGPPSTMKELPVGKGRSTISPTPMIEIS